MIGVMPAFPLTAFSPLGIVILSLSLFCFGTLTTSTGVVFPEYVALLSIDALSIASSVAVTVTFTFALLPLVDVAVTVALPTDKPSNVTSVNGLLSFFSVFKTLDVTLTILLSLYDHVMSSVVVPLFVFTVTASFFSCFFAKGFKVVLS